MTHQYTYEALDITLSDIMAVDTPFGRKFVITGGDCRQVLSGTWNNIADDQCMHSQVIFMGKG